MSNTRILRYILFIACCVIPFLGNNHLALFYITIDKFWIESIFILSLIISLMVLLLSRKNSGDIAFGKFFLFFTPFFAITVLSLFFTWNKLSTLQEINTLLWVAGAVFLASGFPDKDLIMKALIVGTFLSSLCAVMQFTVVYPALQDTFRNSRYASLIASQTIPFSSFLYHNIFGGYLASIIPISLYFAIFRRNAFYSITTIVIITGLILTTTRIGIGLAVLAILAMLILSLKDRDLKRVLHIMGLTCAGVLLAVLIMNINVKNSPKGVQREITQKITGITTQIKTLNTRTEIWKSGLKAFVNKPVLGYGAGAFEYPYKKYYDGGFGTKYAHSTLIKIGVELGIIGIFCWLFYLAGCFFWIRNSHWDGKKVCVFFALCSFFLFSILDFSFNAPAHVITFFLLSSWYIFDGAGKNKKCEKNNVLPIATYGIITTLMLFCILSFYFTTRVNLAEKAIENGTAMEENGFALAGAFNAYEDAIKKMPFNNEGFIKASTLLIRRCNAEKDDRKKEEIQSVLSNYLTKMGKIGDKNSELFYTMGIGYIALSNKEKADYYLKKAIDYLPSSAYYVLGLAEYYFKLGDFNEAKKTIKSFDIYKNNYEITRNPNGFYIYMVKDLEAEIALREGHKEKALTLAIENLEDADREKFIITSARARQLVERKVVIDHLRKRGDQIKSDNSGE